jgi:hypothetical protein
MVIHCADHELTSPTSGGCSVGMFTCGLRTPFFFFGGVCVERSLLCELNFSIDFLHLSGGMLLLKLMGP